MAGVIKQQSFITALSLLLLQLWCPAIAAGTESDSNHSSGKAGILDDAYHDRIETEHPHWSLTQVTDAIKSHPHDAGLLVDLAHIYYLEGDPDLCQANVDRAIAIDPHCARAYIVRSMIFTGTDQWDKALSDLAVAAKIGGPAVAIDATARAALMHRESKQYELSLQEYTKAIKSGLLSKERCAYLNFQRGEVYLRMKKPNLALLDFDAAIKLDPNPANYYLFRGRTDRIIGNLKQALADFTTGIERGIQTKDITKSYEAELYRDRATLYDQLGKPTLAQQDRRSAASDNKQMFDAVPFRAR